MGKKTRAFSYVLGESFSAFRNTGDAKDISEVINMALRWFGGKALSPASGGVAYFVQSSIPGVKNLWEWVFPCIIAGIVYLMLLFWTAIKLRMQMVENEEALIPLLEIEEGKEETTGSVSGWGLIVGNKGINEAISVYAELEELQFAHPMQSTVTSLSKWPTNRPLHWVGQQDDDKFLIPGGQKRRLNVCYKNPVTGNIELSYHRTTGEFRENNALTGFSMAVLALINIVSQGRKPLYALCRIDHVQLSYWATRESFSLLYWGEERPDLAQYQERESFGSKL